MEHQLSLHLKKFNDRVKVMNQTNSKELVLSALEARNLHNDIFELLTQIAELAENHLSVRKSVQDGRTHIQVDTLDTDKRVEELARMLGASPHSESVKEHVKKLMDHRGAEVSG